MESSVAMMRVFVYGTLKPGECNYDICAASVVAAQPAIALGHLYDLPLGYPAMTAGYDPVQGFLLSFTDPAMLQKLDDFERHDPDLLEQYAAGWTLHHNEYTRQEIEVFDENHGFLGLAWAYVMTVEQVDRLEGNRIHNGMWSSHPRR